MSWVEQLGLGVRTSLRGTAFAADVDQLIHELCQDVAISTPSSPGSALQRLREENKELKAQVTWLDMEKTVYRDAISQFEHKEVERQREHEEAILNMKNRHAEAILHLENRHRANSVEQATRHELDMASLREECDASKQRSQHTAVRAKLATRAVLDMASDALRRRRSRTRRLEAAVRDVGMELEAAKQRECEATTVHRRQMDEQIRESRHIARELSTTKTRASEAELTNSTLKVDLARANERIDHLQWTIAQRSQMDDNLERTLRHQLQKQQDQISEERKGMVDQASQRIVAERELDNANAAYRSLFEKFERSCEVAGHFHSLLQVSWADLRQERLVSAQRLHLLTMVAGVVQACGVLVVTRGGDVTSSSAGGYQMAVSS